VEEENRGGCERKKSTGRVRKTKPNPREQKERLDTPEDKTKRRTRQWKTVRREMENQTLQKTYSKQNSGRKRQVHKKKANHKKPGGILRKKKENGRKKKDPSNAPFLTSKSSQKGKREGSPRGYEGGCEINKVEKRKTANRGETKKETQIILGAKKPKRR